jgi:hypothetical protein
VLYLFFLFFYFFVLGRAPPPPNTITKKITLQHYHQFYISKLLELI